MTQSPGVRLIWRETTSKFGAMLRPREAVCAACCSVSCACRRRQRTVERVVQVGRLYGEMWRWNPAQSPSL